MLYQAFELSHAAVAPWRAAARMGREALQNPHNPMHRTFGARSTAAMFQIFENATKRYEKPEFGIRFAEVEGEQAAIVEEVVLEKPFCQLLHFARFGSTIRKDEAPKLLILAPLSGHFATLLRGTVQTMLQTHDVYITDWQDARSVPLTEGAFDLDDYVDYVRDFIRFLGDGTAVLAVCQPGVPALMACSLMAEDDEPAQASSLILMGSPIDTRISPTEPNRLAESRPISWFEKNVTTYVPWPYAGFMRRVYPGFLQLSSFMAMNLNRHLDAHSKQFDNLVKGDGESAAAHRAFYDEYMAVLDLSAEFYLQTVDKVFQRHLLAKGEMTYRDQRPINPAAIKRTALMTIEGAKDDITGLGQTQAAHTLCTSLTDAQRLHYVHPDVGHYGVFNGGKWRRDIYPQVCDFIAAHRR